MQPTAPDTYPQQRQADGQASARPGQCLDADSSTKIAKMPPNPPFAYRWPPRYPCHAPIARSWSPAPVHPSSCRFFFTGFRRLGGTLYERLSINEHLAEVVYNVNATRFFRCANSLADGKRREGEQSPVLHRPPTVAQASTAETRLNRPFGSPWSPRYPCHVPMTRPWPPSPIHPSRKRRPLFLPPFQRLWGTLYNSLSINEHLVEVVSKVNAVRFFRYARLFSAAPSR